MGEDDKYTYPGSGGVLVNSFDIRDAARLDAAMNDVASVAMIEMRRSQVPERPGFAFLREIHETMFRPIVPGIAGRLRDVDVQATGTGIPYCRPEFIQENLDTVFRKLDVADHLRSLSEREFADRLADHWGELSAIHPFRDGNTRSQSAYVDTLAERAGHPIDWERVDVDVLRSLRLNAVAGQDRPLADYLVERLLPTETDLVRPALDPELVRMMARHQLSFPEPARATPPPARGGSTPASSARGARHDENRGQGRER